jgi:hypothetical protein
MKKKPKWEKAKLIALLKGGREEVLLTGCKIAAVGGSPGAAQGNFRSGSVVCSGNCNTILSS